MTMNFMELALSLAREAAAHDEVPVGAVVVWNGEVISRARNRTKEFYDPTAHAEMLVLREACEKLGEPRIPECDLYVSLEPCTMCAAAISFARIRRLYYGAADVKMGGIYTFSQPSCHHKPEIYEGIAAKESAELLKSFFQTRR